jgi:hypothetical protein
MSVSRVGYIKEMKQEEIVIGRRNPDPLADL